MIAMAVLVIPLLLKDPGIQASIEQQGVAEGETGQQTFKSKIEPLNLANLNVMNKAEDGAYELKPALLETGEITAAEFGNQEQPVDAVHRKKKSQESQEEEEKVVLTEDKPENSGGSAQGDTFTAANTSSDSGTPEQSAVANTEDTSKPEPEIENGWSVRVGTFTKLDNVEAVSSLLEKSGFNARRTEVSTNFGAATRVWLGPYPDKETAKKVSTRLKTLTGEAGYVTKHSAS